MLVPRAGVPFSGATQGAGLVAVRGRPLAQPVRMAAPFHQIGKMTKKPCIRQALADLAIEGVVPFLRSAAGHLGKIPMVVLWAVGRRVFRGAKLTNLFHHM